MSGPTPLPEQAGGQPATDAEAREFAVAFQRFMNWAHEVAAQQDGRNEVSALVLEFLGADGARHSVITRDLAAFEHVNLQTALNAWSAAAGRAVEVGGIAIPPHYGGLSLQQLISADGLPPVRLSAPALADLPNGPGSTLGCLRLALLLVTDHHGRYVIMVQGPGEHLPQLQLEVAGLPTADAQHVLAELDALRSALNVYRGHLLDVSVSPVGGVVLTFTAPPGLARGDVILPDAVLARVERHALGVAAHRQALLSVGQHLKRGLLLYGPPGTGKTHTTRYLLGQMTGYTRLVLTGRALVAIGAVADLARALLPATIVLEDVDLVAEDRSMGPSSSPVLFELLDAMDGAAPDADLLFLLTTNRADLLEPALAARPGRVDVAVEIAVPDAPARERLLRLYGRDVPLALTPQDITTAIERTEGTTASFLKELVRRAVLEALHEKALHQKALHDEALAGEAAPDGPALTAVTGAHLARALDDLLDSAQGVTRTLLGVGVHPEDLPAGGLLHAGPVPGMGRFIRARGQMIHRYSG
jgi:DNA polymerase III delta prime subunit